MSQAVQQNTPLSALDACFVKFTPQKGVLKCHRDPRVMHGVWFECPKCKAAGKHHPVTLLFHHDEVPKDAKPDGRYTAHAMKLEELCIHEILRFDCGFRGYVRNGEVRQAHE